VTVRDAIIEELELLSSPPDQLEYEKNAPIANVAGELVSGFCDLFHPKSEQFLGSFTSDEILNLAHLYGLLREVARIEVSSVGELQKHQLWRRVISVAALQKSHYERHA